MFVELFTRELKHADVTENTFYNTATDFPLVQKEHYITLLVIDHRITRSYFLDALNSKH